MPSPVRPPAGARCESAPLGLAPAYASPCAPWQFGVAPAAPGRGPRPVAPGVARRDRRRTRHLHATKRGTWILLRLAASIKTQASPHTRHTTATDGQHVHETRQ